MKTLFIILISFLLVFPSCKKHHTPTSNQPDNPYGLPNATQTGANTLGFLLNGQAWTPQGFNGTANLSINVDFGFNKGIFGVAAYKINTGEHIGFGMRDSLNFISIPSSIPLNGRSLFQFGFASNYCFIDYYDTTVYRRGSLTITKLDKSNQIISGTFNANLYKAGCDTIKI